MTKLLNARDLLDMLRAEEPDPEEQSDRTRGRRRYEGASGADLRVFPRREKVEQRLPMVDAAGPPSPPEPPRPPEPPKMPRPQKVYDLSAPEPPRPPIPPTPPVPRSRPPSDLAPPSDPSPMSPPITTAPVAQALPVIPREEPDEGSASQNAREARRIAETVRAVREEVSARNATPGEGEPIALSSEETLVLLHYDVGASSLDIASKTGLSEWRVTMLVDRLHNRGVLDEIAPRPPVPRLELVEDDPQPTHRSSLPSSPDEEIGFAVAKDGPSGPPHRKTSSSFAAPPVPPEPPRPPASQAPEPPRPPSPPAPPAGSKPASDPPPRSAPASSGDRPLGPRSAPPSTLRSAGDEAEAEAPPPTDEELIAMAQDHDPPEPEEDPAVRQDEERKAAEEEPDFRKASKNFLALYETKFAILQVDARAKLASTLPASELSAMFFDKEPTVVRAIFENVSLRPEHARFGAFHHRTAFGLDQIASRGDFVRDPLVERRLLRNASLSDTALRRMLMQKRLIDIYKVSLDRDVPERSRQSARAVLRTRFNVTDPEDRVQLIWSTEGRVLPSLSGCVIDSKSSAIICSRPVVSLMMVHNFSRFGATPPSVIHHCLKSQLVRRQIPLRNLLLKHPNCPAEAKRAF